jgi:spore coat polysaccharide biosynthesis protein SpsF
MGRPLLAYLIERLRSSKRLDYIIVATTVHPEDDAIESLTDHLRIPCVRGSAEDVLDRYYQAASKFGLRHVVRVCADCPLLDPEILDRVVECYLDHLPDIDYAANTLTLSYPDGLDVEVFSMSFLKSLHRAATKKYQREHVTTYMVENPQLFRCKNVACDRDLSHHRWTVDNEQDFQLIKSILEHLYPRKPIFLLSDVLSFLESRPDLVRLNRHIVRNEGFIRSLENQGLSATEKQQIVQTVLKRSL